MTEKYDVNRAATEAEQIKYEIKLRGAKDYTEANEKVEERLKHHLREIEDYLTPGDEDVFLSGTWMFLGGEYNFPKELREKIYLAMLAYYLDELKNKKDNFLKNLSYQSYVDLVQFLQHEFLKTALKMAEFGSEDVKNDFEECYRLSGDSERTPEQRSYIRELPNESDEDVLKRTKPSIDKLVAKIEETINKYSNDERFSHDPYKLVAEIREDVAKYKAERFPSK